MIWGTLNGKNYTDPEELFNKISEIIGNDSSIESISRKWDQITEGQFINGTIYNTRIIHRNSNSASIFLLIIIIIIIILILLY